MKQNILVQTSNIVEAQNSIKRLQARTVTEVVGLGLDYGPPSTGKTQFGQISAVNNGYIYQRIVSSDTPKSFITNLYKNISYSITRRYESVQPRGSTNKIYKSCVSMLQDHIQVIIIDEINLGFRHKSIFEAIRDFVDQTFSIFILLGEKDALSVLKGMNEHYFDRVNQFVEFKPLNYNDIRLIVEKKMEIPVTDEVINWMAMRAKGKGRQLDKMIELIEYYAKANGLEKVTLEDIKKKSKDEDE